MGQTITIHSGALRSFRSYLDQHATAWDSAPAQWSDRVTVQADSGLGAALCAALDKRTGVRGYGVRSTLRAALRRLDPEAQPASAAPSAPVDPPVFLMYRRKGARTWKASGRATGPNSAAEIVRAWNCRADDGGGFAIVQADTADDARRMIRAAMGQPGLSSVRAAMSAVSVVERGPAWQCFALGIGGMLALAYARSNYALAQALAPGQSLSLPHSAALAPGWSTAEPDAARLRFGILGGGSKGGPA